MFGHQDDPPVAPPTDDTHDNDSNEPIHDAVLESMAHSDSDDVVTPSAPAVDSPSDEPSDFIATDSAGQPDTTTPLPPVVSAGSSDLLSIKQHALQQLSPLVSHLDQTPEEKFHTTMMMIQAADNQDLIKDAYEAAEKITDEKTRAQALLDIINEINYFTQHSTSSSEN